MSGRREVCTSLPKEMSTHRTEEPLPESAPPIVPVNCDGAALAEFLSERPAPAEVPRSAPAAVPVARSRKNTLVTIGVVVFTAGCFWLATSGRLSSFARTVQTPRVTQAQETKSAVASASSVAQVAAASSSLSSKENSIHHQSPDGELIVKTEPAGGRVTVDGIGWGVAPVTIRYLPLGTKRIRVTKDGYAAQERVVHLAPNQPRVRLQIPLRNAP